MVFNSAKLLIVESPSDPGVAPNSARVAFTNVVRLAIIPSILPNPFMRPSSQLE